MALDAVASHPRLAEFEEVCFALYDSRALAAFWRALQSIQLPLPKVDVSTLVITEPAIIERIPRREASTQTEDLPDLGGDPRGTARLSVGSARNSPLKEPKCLMCLYSRPFLGFACCCIFGG